MWPVHLAVAHHAMEKFLGFFRRLDADARGFEPFLRDSAPLVTKAVNRALHTVASGRGRRKSPWTAPERIPRETRPLPIDVRERHASADWLAPAIVSYPH